MAKNIAILFDGTWNKPDEDLERNGDENTNVVRLKSAILAKDNSNNPQHVWYEKGVGSDWYDSIMGGAFGTGLSLKIMEGYKELVENYEEGDQVFIFGFSRGAYSARSLVGFIRNAGLLKKANIGFLNNAYSLYRTRDNGPDSENARFFRSQYSREIDIQCLGVWDTVGALGVPLESFQHFNKDFFAFHDTELSSIVKNAFHALAVDEHRENFFPALWDPKEKPNQVVEQVWFTGAHANIGGGYPEDNLAIITLNWMANKANACGLNIDLDQIQRLHALHQVRCVRLALEPLAPHRLG